jgi:hypothetical protein
MTVGLNTVDILVQQRKEINKVLKVLTEPYGTFHFPEPSRTQIRSTPHNQIAACSNSNASNTY